ncbi:sodium channel protein Nach [Plutella xylostella]|uniref:sodium channel protein Nach n=1 Tax=Plutella xylostella TaxID=51655 RepID=UPI0020326990|nr:sodium channel protein Nach [Plutella xylostella]
MSSTTSCRAHVKEYCASCSFTGVHYIADHTKHWTERCLWLVLVALGWYGSAVLIIAAFEAFASNPISFGVETAYLPWSTRMPAVALCEENNLQRVFDVADDIWTVDHPADLDDVLLEIAYFRGTLFRTIHYCLKGGLNPLCPVGNYSSYANLVRSSCQNSLSNCSYNNEPFDCCEYFQSIHTDLGTCYIFNSIQTKEPKIYNLSVHNRTTSRRGVLRFDVLVPSKVYTLGDDELPTITTLMTSIIEIKLGNRYWRDLAVRNIENDPLLSETSPAQRACRFHREQPGLFPRYSYSACTTQCRRRGQTRRCGCNDHLMPGTSEYFHREQPGLFPRYSYSACNTQCRRRGQARRCGCNDHLMPGTTAADHCNLTGLACLAAHVTELTTLKPPWAARAGLACACLPSCTDTDITVVKSDKKGLKKKKSVVQIALAYLPTERFKRNIVRSRLDLVVSIGGTTGLCVGASILSFVELVFYFTVRYMSNLLHEKKKQNQSISYYY